MAEVKTKKNAASVEKYLAAVDDDTKRDDCFRLVDIMREVTGEEPAMWGDSIVGFGSYHYVYASGREGDWLLTGFAPRKQALTMYIMSGFSEYEDLLAKLGKHKVGKSCLYVKKLDDLDEKTLRTMIKKSIKRPMGEG